MLHAAGWLEGGLTFGFEKFITDIEAANHRGNDIRQISMLIYPHFFGTWQDLSNGKPMAHNQQI